MSRFIRPSALPRISRLSWLMGLYGENYERAEGLFNTSVLKAGRYQSCGHDGLALMLDVIEVHAYTLELKLSYNLLDPVSGQPDPSAFLRVYRDTQQCEATHCYVGRQWQDVLGLRPSTKVMVGHRLRMNSFLNKWLDYLDIQGHAPHTLLLLEENLLPVNA
ncbi:MAG: DUF1249 domain-containing protein [Arenimonas sp.]